MSEIRILNVVSTLDIGDGATTVAMNYYKNINRKRIQFDFLYFVDRENSYYDEIKEMGGKVYKADSPNIKNVLDYRKYIKKNLNGIDHIIIHFHVPVLVSLIAPMLLQENNRIIITHAHSVTYSYNPFKKIRNFLLSLPMKYYTDVYFACSELAGRFWFGKTIYNKKKLKIIKNAIRLEDYRFNSEVRNQVRKELGITDNIKLLGHVGRFSKGKNHDYLVRVFNEVIKKSQNNKLLLIGDGEGQMKIKQQVKRMGLDQYVIFLGRRSDVKRLYQALDLFVFPSISEGLGTTVVEAQAAGLNCIVSDTITREVDFGKVEYLSLKLKPEEWANTILSNYGFGRNNMKKIKENGYCIKNESPKLMEIYERLYYQSER